MKDDELMDQLLRDTLRADVPQLSPDFDSRVLERLRPRRLSPMGRVAIALYSVAAAATAMWFMQDLRMELIAAALGISVPVAVGASAYVRRLAAGLSG